MLAKYLERSNQWMVKCNKNKNKFGNVKIMLNWHKVNYKLAEIV